VNHEITKYIAKRATRCYPKIDQMNDIRSYAGLRPWTEDDLPIDSEVKDHPGFYVAAGHEGDGISIEMITWKFMEEKLNNTPTTIPVDPISIESLSERKVTT